MATKKNFQTNSKSLSKSPCIANLLSTPNTAKNATPATSNQSLGFSKSNKTGRNSSSLSSCQVSDFLSCLPSNYNSRTIRLPRNNCTFKSPSNSRVLAKSQIHDKENIKEPQKKPTTYSISQIKSTYPMQQFQAGNKPKTCLDSHISAPKGWSEQTNSVRDQPQTKSVEKNHDMTVESFPREDHNLESVCVYSTLDINDLLDVNQLKNGMTPVHRSVEIAHLESPKGHPQVNPLISVVVSTQPHDLDKNCQRKILSDQTSKYNNQMPARHLRDGSLDGTTQASSESNYTQENEKNGLKKSIGNLISCSNYTKKKAKLIHIDLENNDENITQTWHPENKSETHLQESQIHEFRTNNSRLLTEESEADSLYLNKQINPRKVEETKPVIGKLRVEELNKGHPCQREEEIYQFRQKLDEMSKKIPYLEDQCLKARDKLRNNLNMVNENIQLFLSKLITIIQGQADSMAGELNLEFGREMIKRIGFIENLQGINKWLQETNMDIESNYHRILHNIGDEPYQTIMGKYNERLISFEQFFLSLKDVYKDHVSFLPTEKLSHFKRKLKTTINDAFTESFSDGGFQPEACQQIYKTLTSSPPLPKMKTLGEFVDFLKSEEKEDVLKVKPNNYANNVFISFENKDMFENALQTSIEATRTENFTHSSYVNTLTCDAILTESDNTDNQLSLKNLETPKLNFKFEGSLPEELQTLSENTFSEYQESSPSVQTPSIESSLNKYMHLLDKVNQKQSTRSNYLKMGAFYEHGKKAPLLYDHTPFINFIENKLKEETIRETCQKSLFHSPAFKKEV